MRRTTAFILTRNINILYFFSLLPEKYIAHCAYLYDFKNLSFKIFFTYVKSLFSLGEILTNEMLGNTKATLFYKNLSLVY